MASARVDVDMRTLKKLYVDELKSIPLVSKEMSISQSTIRSRLIELGVIRTRKDGVNVALSQGRRYDPTGIRRVFSPEHRENLAASIRASAENRAKGVSVKPNGYIEFTRGENKSRSVHVVTMEKAIGRRIRRDEVVHHIDHDKSNNDISNLQLMSRSEHASLHAKENQFNRKRNRHGQFE